MNIVSYLCKIFNVDEIPDKDFKRIEGFYNRVLFEVYEHNISYFRAYKLLAELSGKDFTLHNVIKFIAKWWCKHHLNVKFIFMENDLMRVFMTDKMDLRINLYMDPLIDSSYQELISSCSETHEEKYQNFLKSDVCREFQEKLEEAYDEGEPLRLFTNVFVKTRGKHVKSWYEGASLNSLYTDGWNATDEFNEYYSTLSIPPEVTPLYVFYKACEKSVAYEFNSHDVVISIFVRDRDHIPFYLIHDGDRSEMMEELWEQAREEVMEEGRKKGLEEGRKKGLEEGRKEVMEELLHKIGKEKLEEILQCKAEECAVA